MRKIILAIFLSMPLPAAGLAIPRATTVTVKDAKGADLGAVQIKLIGTGGSRKLNLKGLPPG